MSKTLEGKHTVTGNKKRVSEPKTVPPEFQAFVDARKKPAVFLFSLEPLELQHVVSLQKALRAQELEEIDLVIHCGGGSIHAAYQIVELLHRHTHILNACVPLFAKSAATLLCVGADTIILDELAQLGPLDTQIYEERKGGGGQFTSALNPFKTLEQLQTFSVETLDLAMKVIITRSAMDLDDCLKHAIDFVRVTTGPLITQLNPEKLGQYSRALSVGEEYGKRLLTRHLGWSQDDSEQAIQRLVHGYPSHDYIIDYHELRDIGFQVELFAEEERSAVQGLFKHFAGDKPIIQFVQPSMNEKPDDSKRPEEE